MTRRDPLFSRLDATAAQLNQLARPGSRSRPSAVSIAALVGLALTLAIGSTRRRRSGRR